MSANFRMYAACLASYNAGRLHGEWIELDGKTADAIQTEIDAMLAASPVEGAEEWAAHDWGGLDFGEHPSLEEVAAYVAAMEELDDSERDAFRAFVDNMSVHDGTSLERFRDAYIGRYSSVESWAEEFLEDSGMLSNLPENLHGYFDIAAFARDLELGGDIWTAPTPNGGVFVFNNV